jgi:hypothetical protein
MKKIDSFNIGHVFVYDKRTAKTCKANILSNTYIFPRVNR